MKRFVSVLAVAAVALTPLMAMGATLSTGQEYSLPSDKAVLGNLYVGAATATVGGRVTGDVLAAGGTVVVSGSVGGDVTAGGGTIQVLGPVDGDVRVFGGTVTVNDRVGGDLVVAGGTVHVLPGSTVAGDLLIAGGQLIMDGIVNGSVKMVGGALTLNGTARGAVWAKVSKKLTLGPDAYVGGRLTYSAPTEAAIADGATVIGGVAYTPIVAAGVSPKTPQHAMWAAVSTLFGVQMLMLLGLAALIVWRWRRQALEVLAGVRDSFWQSLGRGIAYLLLVPLAAILLLISFIGTLPGVLLVLGYVAACILAKALAGMLFGSVVVMLAKKRQVLHLSWGSALGGVIGLKLVGLIPVIGWIITAAAWLTVFGVLAHRMQESVAKS